ncbi:tyrosine-type recombinase/integrase [Verrucosispora sp. TAA-831]|uniref:tyrosine-type recombinase/integrase n=1 Tax=Verrucosispora sp. TAA-831 TaxID=3422227 RepID=UPI003D6EDAC9
MATSGVIFKRCGCRDDNGRRREQRCPDLGERNHGTWYFHCSATNLLGRSERVRRGGYPSQAAAGRARGEWLAASQAQRTASGWTVQRWLRHWLDQHTRIRPTTRLHYTRDVERVLIPHLGPYRLADLDARLLRTVFDQIAQTTNTKGLPQSASAMQHLRTTLRAALNLAVKHGLIESNPARHITVAGYRKPHAQVWTDDRVHAWHTTGEHPAVAVWTAQQLGAFLDTVTDDPLFAFWWLTALRGLRRGEMCGLRWTEIDLDRGVLYVERNRTTAGYQVIEGDPKTAAGRRPVALDKRTIHVLRDHRERQRDQKARRVAAGKTWVDSGYVFIRKDGNPLHPGYASGRFRLLVKRAGIPPVRLHDLRHGAASLAHEAGADLKTLQDMLGHSSIVVTADTYTSVLPHAQRRCADATAHLVLAAAHRTRAKIRKNGRRNRPQPRPAAHTPARRASAKHKKPQVNTPRRNSSSRSVMTPEWHPRDTHRPQQANNRKGPDRVPAARTPLDLVRPKGLEPLTF